jgi:hypothetical protein
LLLSLGFGQSLANLARMTAPTMGGLMFAWSEQAGASHRGSGKWCGSNACMQLEEVSFYTCVWFMSGSYFSFSLIISFFSLSHLLLNSNLSGLGWPLDYHLVFHLLGLLYFSFVGLAMLMPASVNEKMPEDDEKDAPAPRSPGTMEIIV